MTHAASLPILGKTQLLAVIGNPIEHSLSPVMQNAALTAIAQTQGLDHLPYVYVPLGLTPDQFKQGISGLAALNVQGFNLTIPHKQAIIPLLTEITPIATRVGAVNTVWRSESGGWAGTNTDVQGFLAPLLAQNPDWSQQTAIILGNGGASRAIIAGCQQMQMRSIHVVGRDRAKLEALQESFAQGFAQSVPSAPTPCLIQVHLWDALPQLLPEASLVVNTTPVGMTPHCHQSPLGQKAIALLPPGATVYDLIYTPRPTLLLQMAMNAGLQTIDGLEMLVQQGAAALEIWTGHIPPIEVMRQAAADILADRTESPGNESPGNTLLN